ncbi:MAG TPA: transposase [Candidatus Acidoferrales bacterium]|nr:transposase [Candidatus Acidoferrales bacterium]
MAEVGLLPFTRIALQVSRAVLPRYRSRFSKHQFTQPQLLAILCLMRYEYRTFREAEVRLGEHRELRQALGLVSVPDFTTLYRFLQRLDDQTIDRAVGETVRRLRGTHRKGRRRARVAVDATGLSQGVRSARSSWAPGRTLRTQKRQALLLGLSFNLYRNRARPSLVRYSWFYLILRRLEFFIFFR